MAARPVGKRNAEDRLRRLLVMLPWLMEVGAAPLADVARRFDLTEDEVQRDLELVAMCGLPPFVDEMIDVFVDDGEVVVGVRRLFTRPLNLTAPEGFSLLAAGRAAMELPGADPAGPLGRGLDKLAAALGVPAGGADDDTAGIAIDLGRPSLADDLAQAVADGAEIDVDYYTPGRDDVTARRLVPRHVFVDAGNWYVLADDERSGERRTFRIDRIERVERTGRSVPVEEGVVAPEGFFADAELTRVVIELDEPAHWVIDVYPVDDVTDAAAGALRVRLPVSSERWLAKLLIRLGPDARVVDPPDGAASARAMARRILERYGDT